MCVMLSVSNFSGFVFFQSLSDDWKKSAVDDIIKLVNKRSAKVVCVHVCRLVY